MKTPGEPPGAQADQVEGDEHHEEAPQDPEEERLIDLEGGRPPGEEEATPGVEEAPPGL